MQINLVPNFHFDLTWHKDVATFMRISAGIFEEALELLEQDPRYRFTIDHVAFIEWFLTTYPEQAARVRRHVASGRLAVVGGMVSMMDCDIPDGETFARQLLYGQRWLAANLGTGPRRLADRQLRVYRATAATAPVRRDRCPGNLPVVGAAAIHQGPCAVERVPVAGTGWQ